METSEARLIKKRIGILLREKRTTDKESMLRAAKMQDEIRNRSSGINLSKVVRKWRDLR